MAIAPPLSLGLPWPPTNPTCREWLAIYFPYREYSVYDSDWVVDGS